MLKKIDRYILKNFLATFFFLMMAFSAIAIVIDFTEKVRDFINNKAPVKEILFYFLNFIPFILALLFPIFIFVSVIFFTSQLANKSEIIAIFSSGVSLKRFLRPYIVGAGILCVLLFFANHYIIPRTNKNRLKFEERYSWEHNYSSDNNFHMRLSPTEYIYMQNYNPETKIGSRFSYEKIIGTKITEKILAQQIAFDSVKKFWKLTDVQKRINDSIGETLTFEKTSIKYFSFYPNDLIERREAKSQMTTPQLSAFLEKQSQRGSEGLNDYYIEKYRRTAAPFSAFVLSIIGACMASRKVRGGSGVHLALGLMISAIYILMMQFSTTFSLKGNLSPMLSVWIPNIFFSIVAFFIYRKYAK